MSQQARQLTPAVRAKYSAVISTPTNASVTVVAGQIVEITSLAEGVYGNWIQNAAAATFDFYVPAAGTRNYEVPVGSTTLKLTSADNVVAIVY